MVTSYITAYKIVTMPVHLKAGFPFTSLPVFTFFFSHKFNSVVLKGADASFPSDVCCCIFSISVPSPLLLLHLSVVFSLSHCPPYPHFILRLDFFFSPELCATDGTFVIPELLTSTLVLSFNRR